MSKTTVQKAKKGAKNENNAQLQSSENVIKNRLEQYLTFSRNRRITADEIKEYKEEQRNRLDVIYVSVSSVRSCTFVSPHFAHFITKSNF